MVRPDKKLKKSYGDQGVRKWITSKRGILTEIAVICNVTPQFVQKVAYGRSRALPGHPVEQELIRRGWPGTTRKAVR